MANIDDLRSWFERDIKGATWDSNIKVDTAAGKTSIQFFTDANEYTVTVSDGGAEQSYMTASVRARKPRAGHSETRTRLLLPANGVAVSQTAWRRLLGGVVGLELVRIHRAPDNSISASGMGDGGPSRSAPETNADRPSVAFR